MCIPGVSCSRTCVSPTVNAPRSSLRVVLVLCDTALTYDGRQGRGKGEQVARPQRGVAAGSSVSANLGPD